MKYSKLLGFFAFVLIAVMSCTSQKESTSQSTTSSSSVYQKWMLVEFQGFSKEELTKLKASVDFTKQADNEGGASAYAGCNRMNFRAEFSKNNQLKISQPMSTMMYCEGAMKLEDAMGKDLVKLTQYKIDGHYLTLSDASGNVKMKFVAEAWD